MAQRRGAAQQRQQRPTQQHSTPPSGGNQQRWQRSGSSREVDPFEAALSDDAPAVEIVSQAEAGALASISKSEVEAQLAAAHRWPRDIDRFVSSAKQLACFNKQIAASCMYTLFRKERDARTGAMVDKPITGPSIRLAEIVASTYRNLHLATRIIDESQSTITAQAVCWDLENNLRESVEAARGIQTSSGKRYGADMIRVTGMAAMSIAMRNVIFRVVPGAFVQDIYGEAKEFAIGKDDKLPQHRASLIDWCAKRNFDLARVLARVSITDLEQLTLEHVETLIGIMTSIKERDLTIEDAFPPLSQPAAAAAGQPRSKASAMDDLKNGGTRPKSTPPAANDSGPTDEQILQALGVADPDAWDDLALIVRVRAWTPDQKRLAYDWANANNDPTIPDEELPVRPDFTVLEAQREPGAEG